MCRPKEEEPASLSTAHLDGSSQAAGNDKTAKMEQESTWATWATLSNLRKPSNLSYPEQAELPCSGCCCSREEWKVPISWSHEPDKVHGCKTTTNERKYPGRKVVLTFEVALTQVPAFTSSQKNICGHLGSSCSCQSLKEQRATLFIACFEILDALGSKGSN